MAGSTPRIFQNVGNAHPDRNYFDLSHSVMGTFDFGYLYPVLCKLCLPGDIVKCTKEVAMRMDAAVAPFMGEVDFHIYDFFVPVRITEKASDKGLWQSYISGGISGTESRDYYRLNDLTVSYEGVPDYPFSSITGFFDGEGVYESDLVERFGVTFNNSFGKNSLFNYLGLIPFSAFNITTDDEGTKYVSDSLRYLGGKISAIPVLAYNKIYLDYFADENLEKDKFLDSSNLFDGGNRWMFTNWQLLKGNWDKDYFSSALPFQQRGTQPAFPIDITGSADFTASLSFSGSTETTGSTPTLYGYSQGLSFKTEESNEFVTGTASGSVDGSSFQAQSFNIASLRLAMQQQRFMERNARAGVRYTEFLRAHWNVSPSDELLDRAQFVNATSGHLIVNEVLQQSPGESGAGVGDYTGHGISYFEDRNDDEFRVKEYGVYMSILMIRPKAGYFQGVPREWLYKDRYEYPAPEFMHLSEQAIMEGEIFVGPDMPEDTAGETIGFNDIFGYQGIYDELRIAHDRYVGGMVDEFDYWHLGRKFASAPQLSEEFVKVDPAKDELHRVFQVQSDSDGDPIPPFKGAIGFKLSMLRPMPFIAEPGLIDHDY